MTMPRFVLAGVPKAGTTSLFHYLRAQAGVYVSDVKEINFLAYPGKAEAREHYPWLHFPVTTPDAYEAMFEPAGERVGIDVSPACFQSHATVARIKEFIPDAGLLLVLRDPVTRAWSAYEHRIRKGYERRPPDEALVRGERAVDLGFYSDRVEELRREFGAERVAVWLFDDLRADPTRTVGEILRHVGATPSEPMPVGNEVHNAARLPRSRALHRMFPNHAQRRSILRYVPRRALRPVEWVYRANQRPGDEMPEATALRLRALYADDVGRLQEILQRDLTRWLPARV